MFAQVLRLMALACLVPALIHGLLGVSGDWIVGAPVPDNIDASLDSQNRFYGVAFGLNAALLWIAARDVQRYATILRMIFAAMFIAGCARLLAVAEHGWPALQIIFLQATEVLIPPVLWVWLKKQLARD